MRGPASPGCPAPSPARVGGRGAGLAQASSSGALGLNLAATATTLESTDEINAVATSYGPSNPSFSGGSTSSPTLDGIYDGSVGDDTLTFTKGGFIGGFASLELAIRDSGGSLVGTVASPALTPADTPLDTGLGLSLELSSGFLVLGDSFDLTVSASTGLAVDPQNPFNGAGATDPGFDPGVTVTAGSFQINGQIVAVAAGDSIDSVVQKINLAGAGVEAAFDVVRERVTLTATQAGSAGQIQFGGDTSGFLAATKLASASPVTGQDDERTVALDRVGRFAGVVAGSLRINGTAIAIDPSVDSLTDVLDRVNGAGAGAIAAFSAGANRVTIRAAESGVPLTLTDEGTGLLAALELGTGTITPAARERARLRGIQPDELRDELVGLGRDLDRTWRRRAPPACASNRGVCGPSCGPPSSRPSRAHRGSSRRATAASLRNSASRSTSARTRTPRSR